MPYSGILGSFIRDSFHFKLTKYGDTLVGTDCQTLFTNFFNDNFGTFYTFHDIQGIYQQTCNTTLDVCKPMLNCTTFSQRIREFYAQYGSIVTQYENCSQLFVSFFNNYYGTNYSWTELDAFDLQLCGHALDVCTKFNSAYLQDVLNDWHQENPDAWMSTTCTNDWVSYFNETTEKFSN